MKCGHCKGDHKYSFEVRTCNARNVAQANREAAKYRNTPNSERKPTERQLDYIKDLSVKKGIKGVQTPETFSAASRTIDYLKGQPDAKNPERPGPVISFMATNLIKDGRYAVRTDDDNKQHVFVRVSRPKTGSYKGMLMVQTQHSEGYIRRLVMSLTNHKTMYQYTRPIQGQSLADVISAIIIDPQKAAFDYAMAQGECCRCGRKLTDDRSAYLGVGPECEKYLPGYVAWVEDQKGAYRP